MCVLFALEKMHVEGIFKEVSFTETAVSCFQVSKSQITKHHPKKTGEGDTGKEEKPGGFWTPAAIFGEDLTRRLESYAGFEFEVLESQAVAGDETTVVEADDSSDSGTAS